MDCYHAKVSVVMDGGLGRVGGRVPRWKTSSQIRLLPLMGRTPRMMARGIENQ